MAEETQTAPATRKEQPRKKRIVVDELRDKAIYVGRSSVIFRPGQLLDSEHMINLAKEHDILTREC
ncbi:MAG: hypothetical protein JWO85_1513 [Candidatus Eremiobacteraeota bacterium]|nr:hypothetical protein [Candidatus Eremiobacteraeota bacterium]